MKNRKNRWIITQKNKKTAKNPNSTIVGRLFAEFPSPCGNTGKKIHSPKSAAINSLQRRKNRAETSTRTRTRTRNRNRNRNQCMEHRERWAAAAAAEAAAKGTFTRRQLAAPPPPAACPWAAALAVAAGRRHHPRRPPRCRWRRASALLGRTL